MQIEIDIINDLLRGNLMVLTKSVDHRQYEHPCFDVHTMDVYFICSIYSDSELSSVWHHWQSRISLDKTVNPILTSRPEFDGTEAVLNLRGKPITHILIRLRQEACLNSLIKAHMHSQAASCNGPASGSESGKGRPDNKECWLLRKLAPGLGGHLWTTQLAGHAQCHSKRRCLNL